MASSSNTLEHLLQENAELRARLEESEAALYAITSGHVDALVINSSQGEQVFVLQDAEHPYRVMVESMYEGAATITEDGTILYANPRLSQMLFEPLETLIGSSILDYLAPDDSVAFERLVEAGSHGPSRAEISFQGGGRPPLPVLASFSPTHVEGAMAVCLVVTDLTEQKRSEEIIAAERLTRSILEQAAEAILVCDTNGKIIRANQAAIDLYPQNPIFQYFESALPLTIQPGNGETRTFSIERVLAGESIHGVEVSFQHAEGQTLYFILSAAPLTKGESQIIGCTVTLADITERKLAEGILSEYAEKLERSNRDLQEFAFVASHDLQEPLRKIEVFGSQIESYANLEETEREYLRRMQDAARRMRKMIEDLLELSRISTRGRALELVDLTEVAVRVTEDLEPRLRRTEGKISLQSLPALAADPMQMQQLLQNLIGNAVKYHRPGVPPQVLVYAHTPAPGWVEICVEDNGIGFDMTMVEQIFQPFRRLHGRHEYDGTGIGLAICKKIAERHGGSITARSELGQGSTFVVRLPHK